MPKSMECHSLHTTETMTRTVVAVQVNGRQDGGTISACMLNSMASTTMTQHQETIGGSSLEHIHWI